MNEKIERLIQGVLELAARADCTPEAIHVLGLEAKQAIWDEFNSMQLGVNILDGIVPYKAEGFAWTIGWVNPSATLAPLVSVAPGATIAATETGPQPNRTARVLYLAREAVDSGRTTITTDEIARTLQKDGDTTARGSLHTAVGNILSRTGTWKRVRTGEYEYDAGGGM